MYVVSILFLSIGLLFSAQAATTNTNTNTGGGTNTVGSLAGAFGSLSGKTLEYLKIKNEISEKLSEAAKDLGRDGIDSKTCSSYKKYRDAALAAQVTYMSADKNTGTKATCSAVYTETSRSCNGPTVATNKFSSIASEAVTAGTVTDPATCKALFTDWVNGNCNQCKSYNDLKQTLEKTVTAITSLGELVCTIEGVCSPKDKAQAETPSLNCEQQCERYKGDPSLYKACLCNASYVMSDGKTTQRCAMEQECRADDSCAGQLNSLKTTGTLSDEEYAVAVKDCECSKVSKKYDPKKGTCVEPTEDTGTSIGYQGGQSDTGGSGASETYSGSGGSGGDYGAAGGMGLGDSSAPGAYDGSAQGADDGREKVQFSGLSKGATGGQFAAPSQFGGGEYGGSAEAPMDGTGEGQAPQDIVEAKGPDIWKIVRDIYQEGIDANRFMDAVVKEEKGTLKKGKKKAKPKGKKA